MSSETRRTISTEFDPEFRLTLDLLMASDPTPLDAADDERLRDLLDRRAKKMGYDGWVDAYHRMPTGRCRTPMWWGTGMPAGHCGEPAWGSNYGPLNTNPERYNHAHRKDMPLWNPLQQACPKHGGPEPSGRATEQPLHDVGDDDVD